MKFKITSPINVAHLTQQALSNIGVGCYSSIGDGRGNITFEVEVNESTVQYMLQLGLNAAFEKVSHGVISPPRIQIATPV